MSYYRQLDYFLIISLWKQYTKLNLAHNMNNTSKVVTLSVIAVNLVAPVKNCWILKSNLISYICNAPYFI